MVNCSILNCKNRSKKDCEVQFFSFPKEKALANVWLQYCRPKTTLRHGRVCSIHFAPSDYNKPSLRHILMNESPKKIRKIKPDAVPSLHINSIVQPSPSSCANLITDTSSDFVTIEIQPDLQNDCEEQTKSTDSIVKLSSCANSLTETSTDFVTKYILPYLSKSECKELTKNSETSLHINSPTSCANLTDTSSDFVIIEVQPDLPMTNCEEESKNSETSCSVQTQKTRSVETQTRESRPNTVTILDSEYKELLAIKNNYKVLYQNLKPIFTPGQLRCLSNSERRRVRWCNEDIVAAIRLKNISPNGYMYLKNIGVPLPGHSTLFNWESKFAIEEAEIEENANISAVQDHSYL